MLRLASLLALSVLVVGATFAVRLGGTPVLPETPYDYEGIDLPAYLEEVRLGETTPGSNPTTNAGATLGRVLFYDTRLSKNGTVSCGTCHRQEHGFSDPRPLSVGFGGEPTHRNSMALAVARYDPALQLFWDERAQTLEDLVLEPIQDPIEMGLTLDELTARLNATDFYAALFTDAFGTPEATPERVALAVSQFVRSITATGSRYDAARAEQGGRPGRPLAGLTERENRGLEVFFGKGHCRECHAGDLFAGTSPATNGLDSVSADPGEFAGRFKVVSLRNVGLTAPYMHDGRFATLEEVVEHYDSGVQPARALDIRLLDLDGRPRRLHLTAEERADLVAFLHTLTDSSLTVNPMWSDPFARGPAAE